MVQIQGEKPFRGGGIQKCRWKDEEGCLLHSQHSLFCGFVQRHRGNKTRNVCLHVCSRTQTEISRSIAEITDHLGDMIHPAFKTSEVTSVQNHQVLCSGEMEFYSDLCPT